MSTDYSRSPHKVAALTGDPAEEFLRLACLTYGDDYPGRVGEADAMLAAEPSLATANVFTMAATGSADALRETLGTAAVQGGPFGWEPLLYLTYARLEDPGDYVESARLLLAHGADPNAGYLWEGLVPPFTALTGAFGGGEGDQPAHRDAFALARVLLEAGADPNDGQIVYNLGLGGSWRDDPAYLELLLEFGFGRGDGGPWKARLGAALPPPAQLLTDALATAALRGWPRTARLLLEHGAAPEGIGSHPAFRGRTPYELAALHGHGRVALLLTPTPLGEKDAFVAACMRGEAPAGNLADRVRAEQPELINRAAEHRNVPAARLLAGLGFDVNHRHRATPLHEAAWNDDVEMAAALVELGADPSIADAVHNSTPLGWAEYGGKTAVAAYLRSL